MILKIKDALDTLKPDSNLMMRTELLLMVREKKVNLYRRLAVAASLLFVLSTLSVGGYAFYHNPVSYLDVDINPSIELGINAFNRVVEVKFFNTDAQELIDEDILNGCKPAEAVGHIIDAASEKGYITEAETTVISLALIGRSDDVSQATLDACAASAENRNGNIAVFKAMLSFKLKEEANLALISAGKLNLIKMVQKLDSTAVVNDYIGSSVTEIFCKLSYLCSDENTSAFENDKNEVRNCIRDVNSQIDIIENKNMSRAGQSKSSQPLQQPSGPQAPVESGYSAPDQSANPAENYTSFSGQSTAAPSNEVGNCEGQSSGEGSPPDGEAQQAPQQQTGGPYSGGRS